MKRSAESFEKFEPIMKWHPYNEILFIGANLRYLVVIALI
jgi:hypothetical protein